jgi:hypothetical protein
MPDRVGDVFTHPADHVAALVLLVIVVVAVIFVFRTVFRVRAAWRASGISLPTVRGLMSMRSMATQMANTPEVQKLIAEQMAMVEGAGQAQSSAERIANLEQLHAQGQITDAKLAELKAAIQKEPTMAPAGVTPATSQTAMFDALGKSGFLSEDMLAKITAAMGAAGVSAAHSSIVTSAMAPDVPGVADSAEVVMRKAQQAKLAMIDDLHNRHVIDDAQHAAAREHIVQS